LEFTSALLKCSLTHWDTRWTERTTLISMKSLFLDQVSIFILWSSGKGQARKGKGWLLRRKASKLKPLPRAYINSLLPLGRYIDMDPCTTELVVSQTQIIRFGQFLLGWICDNQLHFPGIIADNFEVKSWSQWNFVVDIYLFSISILGRKELMILMMTLITLMILFLNDDHNDERKVKNLNP